MDIFNETCGDMPEGYLITIFLENGSACMNITDPKGVETDWHMDDTSFVDQIKEAVKWCGEDSVSSFKPPRYDAVFRAGVSDLNSR